MKGCNLTRACRDMRKTKFRRKERDPTRFVAAWSERELLDREECKAFVLILRTRGCRWANDSGCSFCGYVNDTMEGIGSNDLWAQFEGAMERYNGEPIFKVYTSGSFLDDEEVLPDFQERMLGRLSELGVRRLLVETLPRFATEEKIGWMLERFKGDAGIEFALGLESASPDVLRHSINKPGKVEDFIAASKRIKGRGGKVRIYIVIKPPLLTEAQALEDAVSSAKAFKDISDTISFNPINVQRGTIVERLWRRREYQPPWLWTVIEVLRRTAELGPRIISAPSGGGTKRGAHNCKKCDKGILRTIERFSISGDLASLEGLKCDCSELWKDQLELEGNIHGPFVLERRT